MRLVTLIRTCLVTVDRMARRQHLNAARPLYLPRFPDE
jgi:hypothetical protein